MAKMQFVDGFESEPPKVQAVLTNRRHSVTLSVKTADGRMFAVCTLDWDGVLTRHGHLPSDLFATECGGGGRVSVR